MRGRDLAVLLGLAALWGSSYLFMRLGAGEFGVVPFAGARAAIAAALLLPLLAWRGGLAELRRHWPAIAIVGIANATLPYLLFNFAAMSLDAGLSAIFNAATPLYAALIARLWLHDRLSGSRALGLAVGFAGVSWLVWGQAGFESGAGGSAIWAMAACVGATLLYAFSGNFTKRYLATVSPLTVASGGQLVSALVLALPAARQWPAAMPSAQAWIALLALATACTALAYVLLFGLIGRIGAPRASTVSYLIPVFGLLWGCLFLHERFTLEMLMSCGVILLGAALTTGLIRLRRPQLAAGLLALAGLALGPPAQAAEQSGQERAALAGQTLIGAPAPRLSLKTIDGATIDLGSLYGKQAVYLKFWATWCAPCREQMPHFERTYEQAGPDLAVIAVDTGFNDSLEDVQKYRRSMGLNMPIVIDDGRLAQALNLRVTPQHVVIGRDGRIQYVGHLADAQLDAALQAARMPAAAVAAGGTTAETRHYGIGDTLPAFTAATLDGKSFQARPAAAARPTVLVFLSPWCESYLASTRPLLAANCRAVREQVTAQAKDSHLRWLGIASGLWANRDDLNRYRQQQHLNLPLTLDESGELFRSFGVNSVPTLLLVGADGRILHRFEGNDPQLPQALRTLADAGT